jgi:tetratricopeptide (TPR) repeat protein
MKNLLLLFVFIVSAGMLSAQDDPVKEIRSAAKQLSKNSDDPIANAEELKSLAADIEAGLMNDAVKADIKALIQSGEALNELADVEFKTKTLDGSGQYQLVVPNSALLAFKAFKMAADIDARKKDIAYGLEDSENLLNNFAIFAYQVQDYAEAYKNFAASIEAHDLLKSMGKDSRLDEGNLLKDQYFFTSVSAYYNQDFEAAKPYLMKLYNDGATDAFIYDALYNINAASDPDKAIEYLAKGRELNPDDTGLLFSEINHYLKIGELDKLIGKLEMAIEKEPDNVSVVNTMGSVYDQLHQKSFEEGDTTKANEYFDKAYSYYEQVTEKDEDNFDAIYSMGALYYNKAASYVDKLNELASDFSPAGMKKYDEVKAEMDSLFEEALPYFQRAETINDKDKNTMIALKEIYARLNQLDKSNEYKERLEAAGF